MKFSPAARLFVVAILVASAWVYLARAMRAEVVPPRESLDHLPMRIGHWTGHRDPDFDPKILALLGADDYLLRTYTSAPSVPPVGLYVGYYKSQRQGDTIHSPLNCLPGAGWEPVNLTRAMIDVQGPPGARSSIAPIEVNKVIISKALDRELVIYWYQNQNRVLASEYWGKLYTVLDSMRYHRTDASMVRVITPITGDTQTSIGDAEVRAREFVQLTFPLLAPYLPS